LGAESTPRDGISDLVRYYEDNPGTREKLRELLGGAPDEVPAIYRALSPIHSADRMRTPLLILHGTADGTFGHSVELVKALDRAHKTCEFVRYRSAGHGFAGKDDIDANQRALRFLRAHLSAS